MRRWWWAAVGCGGLVLALAGVGGWRWRAWQAALPPEPAPGHAESVAVNVLSTDAATAVQMPAAGMAFPLWRMELRRAFVHRRQHVRTWLVAVQVRGRLEGMAANAPPKTADVWVLGVEGYCREIGAPSFGPGPAVSTAPNALCWQDLVYRGDTGRMWWGVDLGFTPN